MDELKRCKWADWCVINQNDDKDYVCRGNYLNRQCWADEDCKYYDPDGVDEKRGCNND